MALLHEHNYNYALFYILENNVQGDFLFLTKEHLNGNIIEI